MNSINFTSLVLFLAVVVLAVFIGGREINDKIEETIQNNYSTEIKALKEKLNKQSELINSMININNKTEENGENNQNSATEENGESKTVDKSEDIQEFSYTVENGGITITKYTGKQTNVTVPNKIDNLPVLKIAENAFSDTKVKTVSLPSTCTEIDWFAFYGCYALTTVYISSSVETIGYGAFDACSKSLTIYCEKDSFAEKYARSFGISYSFFK